MLMYPTIVLSICCAGVCGGSTGRQQQLQALLAAYPGSTLAPAQQQQAQQEQQQQAQPARQLPASFPDDSPEQFLYRWGPLAYHPAADMVNRSCLQWSMHACMPVRLYACMPACLYACMPACLHARMPADVACYSADMVTAQCANMSRRRTCR